MEKVPVPQIMSRLGMRQFVVMLLFVTSGLCCLEHVHPGNCTCKPFGRARTIVKCIGITQLPRDLPSNTVKLVVSKSQLTYIQEDAFSNLTVIEGIDLSSNGLKSIPKNTFRNLTLLTDIKLDNNNIKGGFHLPKSVSQFTIQFNDLSLDDLKVILKDSKRVSFMDLTGNPIGPNLTANIFAGFDRMTSLSLSRCGLKYIESGTFKAMKKLKHLELPHNMLSQIQPDTLQGPSDNLVNLDIHNNDFTTIPDGTFSRFSKLSDLRLYNNKLTSVPDFTGLTEVSNIKMAFNEITDIKHLGSSKIKSVMLLSLTNNQIEQLPVNIFQKLNVMNSLDLSFNKLQSIPDGAFSGCKQLTQLYLSFNNIKNISHRTFAGLNNLTTLMLINNSLAFIPENTFVETPLQLLFLHGNRIKHINGNAFRGLNNLNSLTLFDNPLRLLPVKIFTEMAANVTLAISCKNLQKLPQGKYTALITCAPSASFNVILYEEQAEYQDSLLYSGFMCTQCQPGPYYKCLNCSFCLTGTYSSGSSDSCLKCPAGGFYQDEMGQIECKNCSTGTYVPEMQHPGKSATDCRACPYGTRSNETAGYRACRCLHNFYRLDRYGPCTLCQDYGITCENDTAILAPNYFWKWSSTEAMEFYTNFVHNIHTYKAEYNQTFSFFQWPLPKPLKCPYPGSCKGGINSTCNEGYQGTLCATCSYNHYLRFNSCLQCPSLLVTIVSCVVIIMVFFLLFVMVFWGDSRRTEDDRTVADVIMSCIKIVIGFYQVLAGIFSALMQVQWPSVLVSMEKCLKFVEGNILQFAPLSCIHPVLQLDPFTQFILAIVINTLVVCLILLYLFLKKRHINRMEILWSEQMKKISSLKKSCYRNIFLFLLLSYPVTSKKIINILPLPGVCVKVCFTKDCSDHISLLKADYSVRCFTSRHDLFWRIALVFASYPIAFPLLLLVLIWKYRNPQESEELAFGLKVFYENYENKYWFWEILEMYRKVTFISFILLFSSESRSQIYVAVLTASLSGIMYTIFRPIKGKFEDILQTFVLWIIFFNVCLGALNSQPDVSRPNHGENDSILANVLFVILNSVVLILAVGKGLRHLRFLWGIFSSCLMHCFHMVSRGCFGSRRSGLSRSLLPIQNENNYIPRGRLRRTGKNN